MIDRYEQWNVNCHDSAILEIKNGLAWADAEK